ncbi:MAG TPA: MerR family transcriptional regulator [Planctomycetaceae bacterium]|nr:MerR family transcriptional regulator [Planctomycetaceae bacterium]
MKGFPLAHYSPKQVADRLGVSESSVKRWLDQGAVPILRTAGGHRRVSQESVEQLLEQLKATSGFPRLSEMAEETGPELSGSTVDIAADWRSNAVEEIAEFFRISLLDGDERKCRHLVDALIDRGHSPSTAADLLITPAMHGFGHMWERGELSIYQERRACGIAVELLASLKQQLPVHSGGGVAIGGAPEGDQYQLPTAMVELALSEVGWNAKSLGCNLPMPEFAAAVQEYRPRLLWISISWLVDEHKFVRDFNAMVDLLPKQTAVLIGGRAATDSLRPRLRYTGHCDSIRHLVDLARRFES